jgi:hypothetical protein
MVVLAVVRQTLYIFVAVFQSTRDMGQKIADCLVSSFVGLASARNRHYIMPYPRIILSGQCRHPRESSASIVGRDLMSCQRWDYRLAVPLFVHST